MRTLWPRLLPQFLGSSVAARGARKPLQGSARRATGGPSGPTAPGNPAILRRLGDVRSPDGWDDEDDFDQPSAPQQSDAAAADKASLALHDLKQVNVHTAAFVTSAVNLKRCPPAVHPEFAVIGRSNVGKSSLINMLTKDRKLALTSKEPGKTKCINHFIINDCWYLVDLPGYGYAKVSQGDRVRWNQFTKGYFRHRTTLVRVMMLVDASVPPQDVDLACAAWLHKERIPFCLVFTKADKKKKRADAVEDNVNAFLSLLSQNTGDVPDAFLTSATENSGARDLLHFLAAERVAWAGGETVDDTTIQRDSQPQADK